MEDDTMFFGMLKRNSNNPILTPNPELAWADKKVYNCAVIYEKGKFHMIFRAIGHDWISRLGYAQSSDGLRFIVEKTPVFSPKEPWESYGCEDPRVTKIDDTYWMTYTAFDGRSARIAITSTKDFHHWGNRYLVLPGWNEGRRNNKNLPPTKRISSIDKFAETKEDLHWCKAGAIFPEKIAGKYWMFFGDDYIWLAHSEDLHTWTAKTTPLILPRARHFDNAYVEMGPPPIRTPQGWLILYHGIDRLDQRKVYRLGVALASLDDPGEITWRCTTPVLGPEKPYETIGMIDVIKGSFERLRTLTQKDLFILGKQQKLPQAVFCCGAVKVNEIYSIYYAAADTVICLATSTLGGMVMH